MTEAMKEIEEQIYRLKKGTLFSIKDFCDIASYDTAKKVLQRLEKKNVIRRVIDGIYVIPSYSKLTGELFLPSPEDIASYIAKRNNWSTAPSGNKCLNILGLSTQLPMEYIYISDGPSRKYDYYGTEISFKHVPQKDIKDISLKAAVIIEALKLLGREYINDDTIKKIRGTLSVDEQKELLKDSVNVTSWIRRYIDRICRTDSCENTNL